MTVVEYNGAGGFETYAVDISMMSWPLAFLYRGTLSFVLLMLPVKIISTHWNASMSSVVKMSC